MGNEISWLVELVVNSNALDRFRTLTEQMVESTRDEAGVLIYERFNSEDSMNVLVYERYTDSNSALAHLKAYRERFEERFGSLVERKRFSVLGSPSRELRAELNGLGVTEYLSPMAGFSEQKRE